MRLRELLRKIAGAVKPARVQVGGEENTFTDVRAVEHGGLRASQWTADQERGER